MFKVIIWTFVVMTCALIMAGCAFDKLQMSAEHGKFSLPVGADQAVP
jgi:hypothetical protein